MPQLNTLLSAPLTTASRSDAKIADAKEADVNSENAKGADSVSRTAQEFSRYLSQLSAKLDEHKQHSPDNTAVSELAKTMIESTESEDLSADEAWLSMVEELNLMASGDLSLEELSSRHSIDASELRAQLNQALAQFDGDMDALIAQLQQGSGGKGLPPATGEPQVLDQVLAASGNQEDGHSNNIESLLQRIEELSPAQQQQFVASVNELMVQLAEQPNAGKSGELEQKTAQQLADLTAALQAQIRALSESEVELSDQQQAQLDAYGALLDKINQLPLDTIFSQPQNTQQMAEQISRQELPAVMESPDELAVVRAELAELVAAIEEKFSPVAASQDGEEASADAQAWLQTVDVKELQSELNKILDTLENELEGASRGELMALLQSQLEALQALKQGSTESAVEQQPDADLASLNQLLNELNQKLELVAADIRVIDASRQSEPGNALPPVAQALAQASQQLRAQVQTMVQLQQQEGGDVDEFDSADFDNLRRVLSDGAGSAAEQRTATNVNPPGAGLQSAPQSNIGQTSGLQSQNAQRAAEQPTQSAFETARQAQQAIDILGSGASERLRERVSVMFNTRTQAAEMRLDPPDLGRLNIRLNMNQEQATVSFQVTTPQAREALEQSLPRLRELLAEQGIELADANVSEQKQNDSGQTANGQGNYSTDDSSEFEDSDLVADGELSIESQVAAADGRVDYFV